MEIDTDSEDAAASALTNLFQTAFGLGGGATHAWPGLSPVLITPTSQQLSRNTTVYPATTTLSSNCPICQDEMVESTHVRKINRCNHEFHQSCIDTWFESSVLCPICRTDVRETSQAPDVD